MGVSSSSLLDENKTNYIRGQADAELQGFQSHYKRQYTLAFFTWLQDEVEQHKEAQTQLLKQREPPQATETLYSEKVLYFEDTRKWKERLVVVRGDYSLEYHDSYETLMKGLLPRYSLLPAGGTVLTSEEKYMALLDKCFPDPNSVSEESPPASVAPQGKFPVFLSLPYHRDSYFCFQSEDLQNAFISVLTDCIRHQNYDFLRNTSYEAQAFSKAVRFYREEKGHHESWDMLVGSDVSILANLVMEELIPSLEAELLPRLKGKKADRRRAWFATVEAAYLLVRDQLQKGFTALKAECQEAAKQQEGLIRSHMDEIISSRVFLASKLRATVKEPAVKFCSENIQPYLASILEEIMGPISSGFQEVRQHCASHMDQLCQDIQEVHGAEELKQALEQMGRAELQDCYRHVDTLSHQLLGLRDRFRFSNSSWLVHNTQIDMQQLMRNAAYTFELLLQTALKDNPPKLASAVEKVKHRVLKQYDYDSSTVRKRIFQNALVDVTLPAVKQSLAPTCRAELHEFDQYIFADYANFIQVENVYEDILLQILESEAIKVVKEAASLKKHNLFMDSADPPFASQSSLGDSRAPHEVTPPEVPPAALALGEGASSRLVERDPPSVPHEEEEQGKKVQPSSSAEMEEEDASTSQTGTVKEDWTAESAQMRKADVEERAHSAEHHYDNVAVIEGPAAQGSITLEGTHRHLDTMEKMKMSEESKRLQTEKMEMDDMPTLGQIKEGEMDDAARVVKGDDSTCSSSILTVDCSEPQTAMVPGAARQLLTDETHLECPVEVIKDADPLTPCPDLNTEAQDIRAHSQEADNGTVTVSVSGDVMTEVTERTTLTFDPLECTEVTQWFDAAPVATERQACLHLRHSAGDESIEYFTQSVDKRCFVSPCMDLTAGAGQPARAATPDLVKESQEILVEKTEMEELLRGNPDESKA
ncbi:protein Niban 1-like [Brienomyrus brachyistius]|uniref:protein Niban 1-like n=1 Tax=Brienomyrus brachyistius TaxID=42636 RepID=UPI0020B1B0B1|nr:protein Niban 1-like [Brienomyrus brachyistius]